MKQIRLLRTFTINYMFPVYMKGCIWPYFEAAALTTCCAVDWRHWHASQQQICGASCAAALRIRQLSWGGQRSHFSASRCIQKNKTENAQSSVVPSCTQLSGDLLEPTAGVAWLQAVACITDQQPRSPNFLSCHTPAQTKRVNNLFYF